MATLELSNEELYDLHVALCGVDNESYTPIKNKVRKAMGFIRLTSSTTKAMKT